MYNIGLILEGGGMRGVYTAGVLDFFIEKGIELSPIYAVSAGACHACSYISKQKGRAYATNVDYIKDKRYASIKSLIKTGDYFGAEFVYKTIPEKLNAYNYDAFDEYDGNFYVVVTNCETGKAEYIKIGDMRKDIDFIRASSSLPLLSQMVEICGKKYLDGGMSDSIPIKKAIKDGSRKNIVILTRDKSYRKEKNKLINLIKIKYKKYPLLIKAMASRHTKYNSTLEFVEKEKAAGRAYVIRPRKPVEIGRLEKDSKKLKNLYNQGYDDAKRHFKRLLMFLEN
ncbi:MAG: patatin family protein [Firmicutes bacterium]|nr:patatin family protein [Bacillota bacterium]